jgi:hypothetical protein
MSRALPAEESRARPAGPGRALAADLSGALPAEWVKLRSVRSTYYVLGVAVLIVVLAALLTLQGVSFWDGASPEMKARFKAIPIEEYFLPFVQLVVGVLGVLAITSEYATGMIGTSLVAVPRRGVMLAGKATVVAATTLAAGTAVVFAIFIASRVIIGDRPFPNHTAPLTAKWPLLAGMGLSVMMIALVGLGLGTLMRSTAGGIVSVVGLTFVLPAVASYLPEPWRSRIGEVMPPNLPAELAGRLGGAVSSGPSAVAVGPFARLGTLPPLAALGVMALYVALALGLAMIRLARSDA